MHKVNPWHSQKETCALGLALALERGPPLVILERGASSALPPGARACTTSGTQVCTEPQFDWSRTRVATATLKTFSAGLLGRFC